MADAVTVDQLTTGDHACLTFTDPEERLDLVAEFVASGLQQGERVICFADSVPPSNLATELALREVAAGAAIERGQLVMRGGQETWLENGSAAAEHMVNLIARELEWADSSGFPGVRVTADMCWAGRPAAAVQELITFERRAAELFTSGQLTLICQYDRDTFDPVTLALAAETHPKTVAALAYYDTPLLRICRQHRPAGIRIAGEIDYTHAQPLQQALSEALRLDDTIHVNLSKLRFIDVTAATMIAKAALTLPSDRAMIVTCSPEVASVFDLVGAAQAAQMRIERPV
jgi:anti-anti-sigma factor